MLCLNNNRIRITLQTLYICYSIILYISKRKTVILDPLHPRARLSFIRFVLPVIRRQHFLQMKHSLFSKFKMHTEVWFARYC